MQMVSLLLLNQQAEQSHWLWHKVMLEQQLICIRVD